MVSFGSRGIARLVALFVLSLLFGVVSLNAQVEDDPASAPAPPDEPDESPDEEEYDDDGDDTADVDTEGTIDVDEDEDPRGWRIGGDIRPIIDNLERVDRDGSIVEAQDLGVRYRLNARLRPSSTVRLGARLSGRCYTEECDFELYLDPALPTPSGLAGGQHTVDQFYVHWFRRGRFDLAFGRLQTRFVLRGGVFARTLDRSDSHNTNITWTDGAHITYHGRRGWVSHLILQYNSRDGSGGIRREPLDFDDSGAKVTTFLGFESTDSWGPIVQRSFDISYLPSSLLKDGRPGGRREDYLGVVARLAFRVPQRQEGPRLRTGFEIGFAPETPTGIAVGLRQRDDVGGLAWNVVASLMEFVPRHSIGFNYGRTQAGWLLSPQFRPNDQLAELRYQWRPRRLPLIEARVRWREELETQSEAIQRRDDFDYFVRLTWQFTLVDG
jgi:hypothetical protein